MAFNAGQYMQAVAGQKRTSGALQKGASQTASKQIQGAHFAIDEQIKYADKQEKAGSVFSKWKKGASLLTGLAATAFGAPVLAAAMLAGGGTFLGGKIGKHKAKKELDKSKFFKGQTGKMMDYMDKDITKSALTSAVMAGAGAHFRDVAKAKDLTAAGGAETAVATEGAIVEPEIYTDAGSAAKGRTDDLLNFEEWKDLNPEKAKAGGYGAYSKDVISGDAAKVTVDNHGIFAAEEQKFIDNYNPTGSDFGKKGFSMLEGINPIENLGYAVEGAMSWGKESFNKNSSLWDMYKNINAAGALFKGLE